MTGQVPPDLVDLLRRAYAAFNARDIDGVLASLHPDVDWPNLLDGTRARGHEEVRAYWEHQFAEIDSRVEPQRISAEPDGRVVVDVRQVIRDLAGCMLTDHMVQHVYAFRDGLVERMDVR